MKQLARVCNLFKWRYKRRGQLFQNRYKSIVCQEDVYFMVVMIDEMGTDIQLLTFHFSGITNNKK